MKKVLLYKIKIILEKQSLGSGTVNRLLQLIFKDCFI